MNTSELTHTKPAVMCFSGLDPSGGAGIQADIESFASLGCHVCPMITSLTAQNTENLIQSYPVDSTILEQQADIIINDFSIQWIKIGLMGSPAVIDTLVKIANNNTTLNIELDPILAAREAKQLAGQVQKEKITHQLLPLTFLVTPNSQEAHELAPEFKSLADCAKQILDTGCKHILITDCKPNTNSIVNQLWNHQGIVQEDEWPRLPDTYHGSGCTLSSAITACLAKHKTLLEAVTIGQSFAWKACQQGQPLGQGQLLPDRFYWRPEHEAC